MTPLVDSHHHLHEFSGAPSRYPALRGPVRATAFGTDEGLRRDYLAEEYRRDMAALVAGWSVHVEAGRSPDDPVEESAWLERVADASGIPTAIVAYADLTRPDIADVLAAHAAHPRVRGVRQLSTHSGGLARLRPEDAVFTRSAWRQALRHVARHGFSVDLQAPPTVAQAAADLARDAAGVTFVLTHCGHPLDRTPERIALWCAGLDALAAQPNVVVKLSGFHMMNPRATADEVRWLTNEVVGRFGAERCLFGSNFPVDRQFIDGAALRAMLEHALAPLAPPERDAIRVGTARRVYRLTEMNEGKPRDERSAA